MLGKFTTFFTPASLLETRDWFGVRKCRGHIKGNFTITVRSLSCICTCYSLKCVSHFLPEICDYYWDFLSCQNNMIYKEVFALTIYILSCIYTRPKKKLPAFSFAILKWPEGTQESYSISHWITIYVWASGPIQIVPLFLWYRSIPQIAYGHDVLGQIWMTSIGGFQEILSTRKRYGHTTLYIFVYG